MCSACRGVWVSCGRRVAGLFFKKKIILFFLFNIIMVRVYNTLHTLCWVVEVGVRPRRRHGRRSVDPRVGDGPSFWPARGRAPKRSADSSTTVEPMRWERLHTRMYRARRNALCPLGGVADEFTICERSLPRSA